MTAASQTASLRPRGMGELLDQSIRLLRANFLKFIGIIALVQIPAGLLQILSSTSMLSSSIKLSSAANNSTDPTAALNNMLPMLGSAGVSILIGILTFLLVGGIGTAALTRAIADGYMGEPVEILGSYRKIGKRWFTLIGALLLIIVMSIGAGVWLMIPCVGWFTGIGLLFFLTMAILPLLGPIVVLEKADAMTAIRRAWDLGRSRFWWLMGFVGIVYIFNLLVVSGPVLILNTLLVTPLQKQAMLAGTVNQPYLLAIILQQVLSILLSILYRSLEAIAITLAYFDMRMRLEGFDLAVQTLSPDQSIVEQLSQAPISQVKSKIIEWNDVLHFFLLSLAGFVIYAILIGIVMAITLGTAGLGGLH